MDILYATHRAAHSSRSRLLSFSQSSTLSSRLSLMEQQEAGERNSRTAVDTTWKHMLHEDTDNTHSLQWKNVQEHFFTVKCNCPSSCLCLFCNCSLCCFLPLVLQPSLQRRHHLLKPMNPILCSFIPSR